MKICVVGGGPGGLYFAISMKRRFPCADISIFERNAPDATIGWGVVFSGRTREALAKNDAISANRLADQFVSWDAIETVLDDKSLATAGYPFYGIDRRKMLQVLTERCAELGMTVQYGKDVLPTDPSLDNYDIVVAADGVNSRFRSLLGPVLGAKEQLGKNRYIWLGTKKVFDKFRFVFKKLGSHWIWAHAYPFDDNTSTFIVECSRSAWEENGFRDFEASGGCSKLEGLFEDVLDGNELLISGTQARNATWDRFRRVECDRWGDGKTVLIGDAAHTIHFSVGSGTKQAFDDAICLANSLGDTDDVSAAIAVYESRRINELEKLKRKGCRSMKWFEEAGSYAENLGVGDFERALLHRATCSAYNADDLSDSAISRKVS